MSLAGLCSERLQNKEVVKLRTPGAHVVSLQTKRPSVGASCHVELASEIHMAAGG